MNEYSRTLATDDAWGTSGRHAFDEDAVQTPIFAALRRGGRRRPESALLTAPVQGSPRDSLRDPVSEFHRDPLTAPIPTQALVPAPARSAERRSGTRAASDGRHHREPVASYT